MKTYYLEAPPPSLNMAYPTGRAGRRFKSKALKDWQDAAGWQLKQQGIEPVSGSYGLEIIIGRHLMRGDIDNRIKGVTDLLVKMGATDDDRHMDLVTISRAERPDVRITVFSMDKAVRGSFLHLLNYEEISQ